MSQRWPLMVEVLLTQIYDVCAPDALIRLEIGSGQSEAVKTMAESLLYPQSMEVIYDYAGHDRVVTIQL